MGKKQRTAAFQVSVGLFGKFEEYLKQNAFFPDCIQRAPATERSGYGSV